MRYFSGFCFNNEEWLFEWILRPCGLYDVAGFSYGAIEAFEYAHAQVKQGLRVQKLVLISPCMLASRSPAFKRLQIMGYQKDPASYVKNFLKATGWQEILEQDGTLARFTHLGSLEELKTLLNYAYGVEKLEFLCAKGVQIEVFLGLEDAIIDPQEVLTFFKPYGCVWRFKGADHLLRRWEKTNFEVTALVYSLQLTFRQNFGPIFDEAQERGGVGRFIMSDHLSIFHALPHQFLAQFMFF